MKIKKIFMLMLALAIAVTGSACKGNSSSSVVSSSQSLSSVSTSSTQSGIQPALQIPKLISRTPKKFGQMNMLETFYAPTPSDTVFLVSAKGLNNDELIMVKCLQGLIARETSASIYISETDNDEFWSELTQSEVSAVYEKATFESIFKKYKSKIEAIYVYDETTKYHKYLALNLAALNNGIAVSKDLYAKHPAITKQNITTINVTKQYPTSQDVYKYMLEISLNAGTKNYVAVVDDNIAFLDYLYATQTPILWNEMLSTQSNAVMAAVTKAKYQTPAIIFAAGKADKAFVEKMYTLGFGSLDITDCSNLTYFSSTSNHTMSNTEPQDKNAKNSEIYISILLDTSMSSILNDDKEIFTNELWGKHAMGIEIDSALIELAPEILYWYNLNLGRNNEFFVSEDSICYTNPKTMPVDSYMQLQVVNNYYSNILGTSTGVIGFSPTEPSSTGVKYTDLTDLSGIYSTGIAMTELPKVEGGKVIIPLNQPTDFSELDTFFAKLKPNEDAPQFYTVEYSLQSLGEYNELVRLMDKYSNNDYINFLLPKNLNLTAKNYYENLPKESSVPESSSSTVASSASK